MDKYVTVHIGADTTPAQAQLAFLKEALDQNKAEFQALTSKGLGESPAAKRLNKEIKEYQKSISLLTDNTASVEKVINNLSSSTLGQLNRALREVKKQQNAVSGDSEKLALLQDRFAKINEQIKKLKGELADVPKMLANINKYSDSDIARAIQQQRAKIRSLAPDSADFAKENDNLARLRDEQYRRAQNVIDNGASSAEQLQSARDVASSYKESLPSNDTSRLQSVDNYLAQADEKLKQIRESGNKAAESIETMAGRINGLSGDLDDMSMEDMEKSLSNINAELKRMTRAERETEAGKAKFDNLTSAAAKLKAQITNARNGFIDIKKVTSRDYIKTASLDELTRAAAVLKQKIDTLKRGTLEYVQTSSQLKRVNAELQKINGSAKGVGSQLKAMVQTVGSYLSVYSVITKVTDKLKGFFTMNLKLSDQLANIRKVSGLTMKEINGMSNNLSKIDTRTTIEELNEIAYAGAKLGMGKYGAEGLEKFVRASNQVNVALKEDLGEGALTALSKMAEVMGLIPKLGVEKSMLSIGSAMFKLASTSTATSANIVEYTKRLTGMSRVVGITTDQLLALGSASDAMALMPEVSSSSMARLLSSLQTNPTNIEQKLQLDPGTIKQLVDTGQAMDAILLIFEKMKEKGNMGALNDVFKDLGSEGVRMKSTLTTMAMNVDMLRDHLQTSKTAFEEATAVTQEYNIQQETAQAKMERGSNLLRNAFVNADSTAIVKNMADIFYDFSRNLSNSKLAIRTVLVLFNALAHLFVTILQLMPGILAFLAIKGLVSAWERFHVTILIARIRVLGLAAAVKHLNLAMNANVWIFLASAILEAIFYFSNLSKGVEKAESDMSNFNKTLSDFNRENKIQQEELKRFKKSIDEAAMGSTERNAAIKNFNDKFGTYLSHLLTEKSTVQDVAKAYNEAAGAIRRKIIEQLKEKDYEKILNPRIGWEADKLETYDKSVRGTSYSHFNGRSLDAYFYANKHKTLKQMMKDIASSKFGVELDDNAFEFMKEYRARLNIGQIREIESRLRSASYSPMWSEEDQRHKAVFITGSQLALDHPQEYKSLAYAFEFIAQKIQNDITERNIQHKYRNFSQYDEQDVERGIESESSLEKEPGSGVQKVTDVKREQREALKDAQEQAKAMIDNIQNYFQRQITATISNGNKNGMSQAWVDAQVDLLETQQELVLTQARKGIVNIDNDWDEKKQSLGTYMVEQPDEVGYNESQVLLDNIISANPGAINKLLVNLSNALGLPFNAVLDSVWRNATLNEKKAETIAMKRRKEIEKRKLEDNYTGKVDNEHQQTMETLGYFAPSDEQVAIYNKGGEEAQKMLERRTKEIEQVFKVSREKITDIYAIDIDSEGGADKLLKLILGENYKENGTELPRILDLSKEDMHLFYDELIKYSDDYTEALNRARERQEKIIEFRWKHTAEHKTLETAQKRAEMEASGVSQFDEATQKRKARGERVPRYDTYGTSAFISSLGHDPELDSLRLKMEMQLSYYNAVMSQTHDIATERDAELKLMQAEMEYAKKTAESVKQRINDVYAMAEPIENFGTAAGEAFAKMTEDAEEGRKAMRQAIGDMINAFMKQTVEMSKEYIKRRIMQKMNDHLTSVAMKKAGKKQQAQEQQTQEGITGVREVAGDVQVALEEQVGGEVAKATQKIGTEALATKKENAAESVQTDVAETQSKVTLGIAEGAANTVGHLGWWGIPLIAVITAVLNGLLATAMSKVSSLFGGGSSDNSGSTGTSAKLVTGMLTYDAGNVQSFGGVIDGRSYPVVGDDGRVYSARNVDDLQTGLVRDPITALVNGEPALVAERGPEIVIGRETTAAIMMARPDLLAEIVRFDRARSGRSFRTHDTGNVGALPDGSSSQQAADMATLRHTVEQLSAVLMSIQRNGIKAQVNKYGRGGVTTAAADGADFMRRNSGDRLWNK